MTTKEEIEKMRAEAEAKEKARKRKIASKRYIEEKEDIKKRSFTSFGKLILSDENSAPLISFPVAKKFNKAGVPSTLNTPGPIYQYSDKFKYKSPQEWSIGNGKRPPLSSCEKFEYYNHTYDEYKEFDLSLLKKKWEKVQGGAIGLDPRIKFEIKEIYPGPGRYEPKMKQVKPTPPAYYLGEKGNITSIKVMTSTNENVGPDKYPVESCSFTSKHQVPPKWSLPMGKRKGLDYKVWTKNETYYLYK